MGGIINDTPHWQLYYNLNNVADGGVVGHVELDLYNDVPAYRIVQCRRLVCIAHLLTAELHGIESVGLDTLESTPSA